MPEVKKNESQKDYISRCVKQVINEGRTQEQALGKCYEMWKQGQKVNDSERLLARYYAEYRKIDKIEDKEVCKTLAIEKLTNQGLEYTHNLSKVFDNLDKLIDGECNCQNVNDAECVERIQDKFTEEESEKVKEEFKLEFPIEDILEGLNVELEHKDITHGDLEEIAKIVISHLKERSDYYKKLKKYVETKDSSIIYDKIEVHNKKATIMRDGYYSYLAKEVNKNAFYPMDIIKVYRPAEEIKKAYDRFMELKRIPAIANHPENDLDLSNPESFKEGEGINPKLKLVNGEMLLDCDLNLLGKTKEFYDKGIKEISCGWHGTYEKVNDESKGYQYIQRFKDFNHIAILERGRCGGTCSIKDNQIKNEVLEMEITKEELEKMVNDKVAEILDAKAANIGEVREWKGGKYKKIANGNWKRVETEKGSKEISEKEEKFNIRKLKKRYEQARQEAFDIYKFTKDENESMVEIMKGVFVSETGAISAGGYLYDTFDKFLKDIDEYKSKILDAKALEGKEKNEEDIEDAYFESDEDEDDIEKAKGKLKRLKDCYKKMKDKNKTVKDENIKDLDIEIKKVKDEMIKDNKGIFEVIEKGIFSTKEVNDKLPCEIKAMTVKKVLDKEISVDDVAIDTLFEVALKNFKNPIWELNNKISINDIDTIRKNSKKELEELATVK